MCPFRPEKRPSAQECTGCGNRIKRDSTGNRCPGVNARPRKRAPPNGGALSPEGFESLLITRRAIRTPQKSARSRTCACFCGVTSLSLSCPFPLAPFCPLLLKPATAGSGLRRKLLLRFRHTSLPWPSSKTAPAFSTYKPSLAFAENCSCVFDIQAFPGLRRKLLLRFRHTSLPWPSSKTAPAFSAYKPSLAL
jgi:hypothetical protein